MQNAKLYPAKNPKATLLIVHGMTEHQDIYHEFANFLAANNICVMTFDHLGHGQAAFDNKTLGFMGNPNPAELMIDNVMSHAYAFKNDYPELLHFVLGHSMGSFIVRCLIQRFQHEFDSAIIMGTSSPNPLCPIFVPVTKFLNNMLPNRQNMRLDLILGIVSNAPFRHEHNQRFLNWLNSNPQRIREYLNDPLFGFCFTNNGFYALMAVMQEGTNKNWWKKVAKNLPMLFVSGEDDPVGKMGKGIPLIVNDLRVHGFADVTAKLYPNDAARYKFAKNAL